MVLGWSMASAVGTAIWVPNGLSRVGLSRVRPDSEFSGNPVATLGDAGVSLPAAQPCWYCDL